MTTSDVAENAISAILGKSNRTLVKKEPGAWTWKYGHVRLWGPGKTGKTHLGLNARTSEIRKPDVVEGFQVKQKGEVIIPSKPLRVAHANFDRAATTVIDNLDDDIEFLQEELYTDEEGELLIPVVMSDNDFIKLFARFEEFIEDAVAWGAEMVVVDGGTVVWEDARHWKLPNTDDDQGIPPKAYANANTTMRARVMQRLHGLKAHTVITCEAREVWASAREPSKDDQGNVLLKPDGWNKTGHYVDLDVRMRWAQKRSPSGDLINQRIAVPTEVALRPEILGREFPNPTFEQLFRANYRHPLLKLEDLDEYRQALKGFGRVSIGAGTD